MSLGRATIGIVTPFDLAAAAAGVCVHGGSLSFTLRECDAPDGSLPLVIHTQAATGNASARYSAEECTLELQASAEDLAGDDLLFIAYLLLETQLQRLGFITLHGAAIEREGRAVVLLGHSGAWKTSSALALCRDFDCRLIGNDLVIVGGVMDLRAISGTKHVRLRYSSVHRCLPELMHLFGEHPADPWRAKQDVAPEEVGITLSRREASEVVASVFVHVDEGYGQCVVSDGDTWIHRINLYENALRHIRATAWPWLTAKDRRYGPFIPSLDDASVHAARTATLDRLLQRSWYVAGGLRDVAGRIDDLLVTSARHPASANGIP